MSYQTVCRLCLEDENPIKSPTLRAVSALKEIFSIEVVEDGNLTEFLVCEPCKKELLSFYKFYLQVKLNQEIYMKAVGVPTIKNYEEETVKPKKELQSEDEQIDRLSDYADYCPEYLISEQEEKPIEYVERVETESAKVEVDIPIVTEIMEQSENIQYILEEDQDVNKLQKPNLCTICGRSYTDVYYFKKHLKKHETGVIKRDYKRPGPSPRTPKVGPQRFTCDICGTTKNDKCRLREHIETIHMKLKNATCYICGGKFHSTTISSHMKKMHDQGRKREKCEICNKFFMDLKQHTARNHNEEGDFPCVKCGKILKNRMQLGMHMSKRHPAPGKFQCTICGKHLTNAIGLKEHMHACHYGGFLYQCEYCNDYRGNHKRNLLSHYRKAHPFEYGVRQEKIRAMHDTQEIPIIN